MDATQAHYLGYATAARIGLRNTQIEGLKTASADDLHTKVGRLVQRHGARLQKKAAHIRKFYEAITA
jgi:hypothetical protein